MRVLLSSGSGKQPFEKVKERTKYDHKTRKYYSDRALGKLSDDKVIIRRLQNELTQAVRLGESIPKITKRIRDVTDMSYRPARTVARTETQRVANEGRMLGLAQAVNDYGIEMDKQWLATIDAITRDTHVELHLVKVPFDEKYITIKKNELLHPLDPDAPPSCQLPPQHLRRPAWAKRQ